MKLTYRGVAYEYNPPEVAVAEGQVTGKYRGLDWRFRNLKKPPVVQPAYNLTYRGVKYSNSPVAAVNERQEAPLSVLEKARALMLKRERSEHQREQAMFSRLADEVGLEYQH